MKKSLFTLLVFAVCGLAAEEHSSQGIEALIMPTINFAIFAAILFYFTRKKIADFFETRERELRTQFEDSKKRCLSAEEEISMLKQKLSAVEGEKKIIIEKYAEKSSLLQQEILNDAKKEAEAMRYECSRIVDAEVEELRKKIVFEFVESILASVEKKALLLSDEKKAELRKEFIASIGKKS